MVSPHGQGGQFGRPKRGRTEQAPVSMGHCSRSSRLLGQRRCVRLHLPASDVASTSKGRRSGHERNWRPLGGPQGPARAEPWARPLGVSHCLYMKQSVKSQVTIREMLANLTTIIDWVVGNGVHLKYQTPFRMHPF